MPIGRRDPFDLVHSIYANVPFMLHIGLVVGGSSAGYLAPTLLDQSSLIGLSTPRSLPDGSSADEYTSPARPVRGLPAADAAR